MTTSRDPTPLAARRSVVAFRATAAVFGAATVFVLVLFVRALFEQQIRSGLFTYAVFTGAAAFGLWRRKRWGRGVALVIALGNVGLGALTLLAVILDGNGSVVVPAVLLVTNLVLGYTLGRSAFDLDDAS